MTLREIESVKDEGNREFSKQNYYKAIMLYEEGMRRAQAFTKETEGKLEYRMEFGDHSGGKEEKEDPTGGYGIYQQDLSRMKAMLYNNISTCYFHMGNV
jgi:hypothetical protein